jgi:N-acetylmuramoyl-L-alanine amidase
MPPIPSIIARLGIRVQYPARHQRITTADSNFVFGTVGTGDARLEVNGRAVPVEANGAFLAWLAGPPRTGGDTAVYVLVARRGAAADTLHRPVLLPVTPATGPAGSVWIDSTVLAAPPLRWALPEEPLELEVRGAPGLEVWLDAGGERFDLRELAERQTTGEGHETVSTYVRRLAAGRLWEAACQAARWADPGRPTCGVSPDSGESDLPATQTNDGSDLVPIALVATDGWATVRLEGVLPLRLLFATALPVAELREAPDTVNGHAGVVVGRPTPYGPYRWRFPQGTRAAVTGRVADRLRLRLSDDLVAWVVADDAVLLEPGATPETAEVLDVRVEPADDHLFVRLGLRARLPVETAQPDARTITLTVHGGLGGTNRIAYGAAEGVIEAISWDQLPGPAYRLTVRLRRPLWGYRLDYEGGAAEAYEGPTGRGVGDTPQEGGHAVLALELRLAPIIDRSQPLRGRRVAIDAGHPPVGATGPTGYRESEANLAIARRLAELLRREGAEALLVRDDELPMGLYERTERARNADAELFVSIHNNALPDGISPFGREGSSTYYYHPHARDLARHIQNGMVREMGLRDLGILWGGLAVTRMTWMPSVLTEGAFMIMPRHEAALRRREFQERYARGVLEGVREFLRQRAGN